MEEYLDEAGVVGDERADLVLALDEACANVIRHAFPGGSGRISMLVELSGEQVLLQVEDDGVGFDAAAPRPEAGPYDTSGRGLSIMREVMTSVDVDSSATGGTRVVMRKVLSGRAHDLELTAH